MNLGITTLVRKMDIHLRFDQELMEKTFENTYIVHPYTLKKCWVVLTQFWVKYGQTQTLG